MEQPTTFRAGDSVSWTIAIPAHAASAGWVLKYRLLTTAGLSSDITATASGDDFTVDLSAEQTASWSEGKATLVRIVEKGAQFPDNGCAGLKDLHRPRGDDQIDVALAVAGLDVF